MSRHAPEVGLLSWRIALAGLAGVTSVVIFTALVIARQGQTISTALISDRMDEQWTIRAGRVEGDGLVLQPPIRSVSIALYPNESATFTLQTQVTFTPPQGAAGLIVQADDLDHFSAFLISGDGYFRIGDYRDGEWIDRAAWRAWPHIRRDGAANTLLAECQFGACTFYVNGEWTWQEPALPATRWIGVIADAQTAGKPLVARFDHVGLHP